MIKVIKRLMARMLSTKDLTDELVKRGVSVCYVNPYVKYAVKVKGINVMKGTGPAILIENID